MEDKAVLEAAAAVALEVVTVVQVEVDMVATALAVVDQEPLRQPTLKPPPQQNPVATVNNDRRTSYAIV